MDSALKLKDVLNTSLRLLEEILRNLPLSRGSSNKAKRMASKVAVARKVSKKKKKKSHFDVLCGGILIIEYKRSHTWRGRRDSVLRVRYIPESAPGSKRADFSRERNNSQSRARQLSSGSQS
jgi:hypothetical protein